MILMGHRRQTLDGLELSWLGWIFLVPWRHVVLWICYSRNSGVAQNCFLAYWLEKELIVKLIFALISSKSMICGDIKNNVIVRTTNCWKLRWIYWCLLVLVMNKGDINIKDGLWPGWPSIHKLPVNLDGVPFYQWVHVLVTTDHNIVQPFCILP